MKRDPQPHPIICLQEATSTNEYVAMLVREADEIISSPSTFVAHTQTAGRGQVGNKWHSSPGANLTFTTFVRHTCLPASASFAVSELAALAAMRTIQSLLPRDIASKVSVKWANDIYVGDCKIGGILIEHNLIGDHTDYSLVGIGLNINETQFPTGIPNPTSIKLLSGRTSPLQSALSTYTQYFDSLSEQLYSEKARHRMHKQYLQSLYRRKGFHLYRDATGIFAAKITDVETSGCILLLRKDSDDIHRYIFRQIAIVSDQEYPQLL